MPPSAVAAAHRPGSLVLRTSRAHSGRHPSPDQENPDQENAQQQMPRAERDSLTTASTARLLFRSTHSTEGTPHCRDRHPRRGQPSMHHGQAVLAHYAAARSPVQSNLLWAGYSTHKAAPATEPGTRASAPVWEVDLPRPQATRHALSTVVGSSKGSPTRPVAR